MKTKPCDVYPKWTESRFFSFLRSALRKAYSRWPPKFQALREACRGCEKGRQKYEYQCTMCKNWFPQKQVQVDHIVPCGSLRSWDDFTPFAQRLFCSKDGLRVVCKDCHKELTRNQ